MESTTVHYLSVTNQTATYAGPWTQNHAGIVFILSPSTQIFIPWGRVVKIEQYINTSGFEVHEVYNKQLSQRFRSN